MDSASAVHDVYLHNYFHFMAIAILYYDQLITLPDEISYMWIRPKNVSVISFFVNRYLAFFGYLIITLLTFLSSSPKGCKRYESFRQSLLVTNQVLVCLLLTLRSYALYGRDWRVLTFLIGGGAILASAAAWSLVGQHNFVATNIPGCHIKNSNTTGIHLAVAWEALFVFDILVFVLIVLKTYKARHRHTPTAGNLPIVSLVLRDGAFYFAVMALANLSNILMLYLGSPLLKGSLSTFASSISVSMMSRLMLNLHKTAEAGIFTTVTQTMSYDRPIFTTHIAPMTISTYSHNNDVQDIRRPSSLQWEMQDFSSQDH